MGYDVFLSHRGPDKPFIEQLAAFLEPDISCWYAPRDILESETYSSGVLSGVESSSVFLVFLTEEFEKDPDNFVTNEVFHARKCKKKIIPVIKGRKDYPRVLEMHLNAIQWFDFDSFETVEEALQQLRSIIQLLLNGTNDSMNADQFLTHLSNRVLHTPDGFSQVSETLLAKHKQVFIPTVDFSTIMKEQPLFAFYGDKQAGKTIHAVNFLYERGHRILFEGLSVEALKALSTQPLHDGAGYFIKIDGIDLRSIMTESFLDQISARLKKAHATLILCTDEPVKYVESTNIQLPSNPYQFILKHLNWQIDDPIQLEEAEYLLTELPVSETETIDFLFELVDQVRRTVQKQQTFDQLVETVQFLKLNHLQLPFELNRDTSMDDILYALAISLCHGKSQEKIDDTHRFFVEVYKEHFPAQPIHYQERPLSSIKADFKVKVVEERVSNHLGSFEEEHIYYQYEIIASKIWPIIWREYSSLREYLATVLLRLIGSKNTTLITTAEEIMHSITESRFQQGIDYFISPMAKSMNLAENVMAKRLLVQLYEESTNRIKILRLLKNWMYTRNRRLEHTAMLALQSKIGIENFGSSLEWFLDLFSRGEKFPQTFYLTLSYLSKYIYLDTEFERFYYRSLATRLKEWSGTGVYVDYVELLAKVFSNHTPMYYKSQSTFVEAFVVQIIHELVVEDEFREAATLLIRLLDAKDDYIDGREIYKSLLKRVRDKLDSIHFQKLIEIVKKGD